MNKYQLGEKLYSFNVGGIKPLVANFQVSGIVNKDGSILYTKDMNNWIKEEYLFKSRMEAYTALITEAQAEMLSPDSKPLAPS